ncbi:MAG: lysylphosphatidylglycerol synthase domain-containing protein [Gaiellaceae bacterium]
MRQALELVLAGSCFGAGLVCCAVSWRTMLAAEVGVGGAVARYGVGSLANTFLPGQAGDAVRVGLFGQVAPGGVIAVAGAVAGVGAVRWLALVPLGIVGTLRSALPPLALLAAAAALLPLPIAWLLARRGSRRARAALAPLRCARRATYAAVLGWVCGTLAARVAGVAVAGAALGVPHPLAAALLVVPALELAGVVPLTPGNVGIAGGAAAVAFHAQGAPVHTALAAGLALHAVETAAALVVGAASAVTLLRSGVRIRPRRTSPVRHRSFAEPLPM